MSEQLNLLKKDTRDLISKYPHIKDEFLTFYQLCMDEIEEGESESNEIELCRNSFKEVLIENQLL